MTSGVEVRRSTRRRRVSARREGDTVVVLLPAGLTPDEERRWVAEMVTTLADGGQDEVRRVPSDAALAARAGMLSHAYLGGLAKPASVTWVAAMSSRWGSCTPSARTIRLSRVLEDMPVWVVDYVLLHELAHLLQPSHGPEFWSLLRTYPKTERAIGYLQGHAEATDRDIAVDADDLGLVDPAPLHGGREIA